MFRHGLPGVAAHPSCHQRLPSHAAGCPWLSRTRCPWLSRRRNVTATAIPGVALGASGIQVSRLALGSWRTFERISRARGVRVMQAARDAGINFLDDARYNDETGHAPIPTGYSEVVFGELFRGAGWRRDDTIVSNKLWWEFWPDQSPAQELAGSLARMRLDHVDLIFSGALPDGVGLEDAVGMITGL